MSIIIKTVLLIFLGMAAMFDLKEKKIPVLYILAGFLTGVVLQIIYGHSGIYDIAGGCLIGCALILVSYITRGQIGYGDGMMLIATGIFLGVVENTILLLLALLIAGVVSAAIMLRKHHKKQLRLPFIPFMLAGYVGLLVMF